MSAGAAAREVKEAASEAASDGAPASFGVGAVQARPWLESKRPGFIQQKLNLNEEKRACHLKPELLVSLPSLRPLGPGVNQTQ